MKRWFLKIWRKWKAARPDKPNPPIKEVGSIFTIALMVGHTAASSGADSVYSPIDGEPMSEYEYWTVVTKRMHVTNKNIIVTYRDGMRIAEAVKAACGQHDETDLYMELHFNGFNGKAYGCSAIYGTESRSVADSFCRFMEDKGKRYRRIKFEGNAPRGSINVRTGQKYAKYSMLVEPFFGDNPKDYVPITVMAEYLSEYLETL